MLVLFKIPAYFGDGNKIRRATQSPPFQGRSFPRKAKFCCCVSFPPCPQARSILPQRNPGPCGGGTAHRTMRGQVWAETPLVHHHLVLRKKDQNWQNAEARQSSKPTCRKKGDGFYFTEYQNKSGSPMETASPELTFMPQIPHSIATDLGKSWQEGGAHRKRQEK